MQDLVIIPFAVDINQIHSAFGSKNEELFQNVQRTETYKFYDEENSFKRELYDIIYHYIPQEQRTVSPAKLFGLIKAKDGRGLEGEWDDYAYALLTLCDYYGQIIINHQLVSENKASLQKLLEILNEYSPNFNTKRFVESRQLFDTPYSNRDIFTNCFYKNEITFFLDSLIKIEAQCNNNPLQNTYYSLKQGLEFCIKNNYDLVFFSYKMED